ncbi:RimK family alpha-L-glutamate ligase [Streptomyces sp. WAC 01325]|uniref:ATP-grasp domain-containing protein n=1 Tax=Streptomyces sp. WAC 01325 TaxID=2203202 RepID=UPI00163CCA02|nr:hypothetical protein [Streptomyces sp. WAC 01325]
MSVPDLLSVGTRDLLVVNGEVFRSEHPSRKLLELDDAQVFFCGIEDIRFDVGIGQTRVSDVSSGRDLADFGLIQVASYPRPTATLLGAVSAYLEHHGRPAIGAAPITAPTKLYQVVVLAQNGLSVPDTIYLSRKYLPTSFVEVADRLGMPFVLKAMNGSGGRLNFLIETEVDYLRYVEDPEFAEISFLAQEFIPNNGTFRALTFGREVPIVMHRCNTDGSHLTNTEQGGHATLFDVDTFDAEVLAMATRAAELMGCGIAGINLVQHRQTRQWYLLEVSSSPAIGSGSFAAEKTRAYSSYLRRKLTHSASQDCPAGTREAS